MPTTRVAWPSDSVYNPIIRKPGGICPAGCSGLIFDRERKSGYLQPGYLQPGIFATGMLWNTEADFCDVIVIRGSVKTIDATSAVRDGFHMGKPV